MRTTLLPKMVWESNLGNTKDRKYEAAKETRRDPRRNDDLIGHYLHTDTHRQSQKLET